MKTPVSIVGLNGALTLAVVMAIAGACLIGTQALGLTQVLEVIAGSGTTGDRIVVLGIRLPRALAAFTVGFSLGLSGAALQGLLRNPLAEPGVLGVSASASLAATIVIYYNAVALSPWMLPLAAIGGALLATALLALAARRQGSVITLILIGVGLSSLAGALMSLMLNLAPTPFTLSDMINWSLGSVANRSFQDLLLAAPFMLLGVAILMVSRRGLTALMLGEESAAASGLNLTKQRWMVVAGTGLATGAAVSIAGAIGFVGLVAPHLVRPWVRQHPAHLLIPSGLLAGLLLVVGDVLVRILPTTTELNLGVVAALFGAPVFILIVLRRGHRRG